VAYLRDNSVGTALSTFQDIEPSSHMAFDAAVSETWSGNPTVLGFDAAKVGLANRNAARLSAYDAGQIATAAGMRDFAPGEGEYTREALDMIIERKRQERVRQDVIGRTPYSLTGTPLRGLGMLGASVLDPLNIASAFVPVVGEARYAALLGQAGSGLARAGVRAGVGVIEGAAGAAILEPAIMAGHAYLDDDYTMNDSLLNIAFGGFLGGGLHVAGGAFVDALLPGRWDKPKALSDLDGHGGEVPPLRGEEPAPGSAADMASRVSPETRNETLSTAVAHLAEGKTPNVEPLLNETVLPRGVSFGDAGKVRQLVNDVVAGAIEASERRLVRYGIPTEEVAQAIRAASGIEAGDFRHSVDSFGIRHILKEHGTEATELPRGQIPITAEDIARIPEIVSAPDSVSYAGKDKAGLDLIQYVKRDGDVLTYVEEVRTGRRELVAKSMWKTRDANTLPGEGAPPAVRGTNALGDVRNLPHAGGIISPEALRSAAARQASPEASITADFPAAKAADERLAAAPKSEDLKAAEAEMTAATDRLKALTDNLVASGGDPKLAAKITEALAPFDEAIKDAGKLGDAVKAAAICGLRQ